MYNENVMPGVTTGIAVGALPGVLVPSGRDSAILSGVRSAAAKTIRYLRAMFKAGNVLFAKTGSRLKTGGELYENGRPRYRFFHKKVN